MKIGIVTLAGNYNYGNQLQNYAAYHIVKSYGYSVDTIKVQIKQKDKNLKINNIKSIIMQIIPCCIMHKIVCIKGFISSNLFGDLRAKRSYIFSKFAESHITQKIIYVNKYERIYNIKELRQYDYILTGSDQVWNPNFAGTDYYFLTFVPPEKRIGFIASIGVPKLPDEQKERYRSLLAQMKYISVREESAVQIIDKLIHKKVDCFLDPVLLLEREKWERLLMPVAVAIPSKYILSFFLGEEPNEAIRQFADRKKLKVIHMDQREYPEYYTLNPAQLLYMINNAEYILTDSFHVTAFSIIFQKQFFVFRRKQENMENMFSRMETLLGRLGLMERIQDASQIEETGSISEEQYREIAKMLVMERKRLDETMKKVLK